MKIPNRHSFTARRALHSQLCCVFTRGSAATSPHESNILFPQLVSRQDCRIDILRRHCKRHVIDGFALCAGCLRNCHKDVYKRQAPESSHAIRAAIDEALKCKETGEKKKILFGLTGTGYFDMSAYMAYQNGTMADYVPTDEELAKGFASLPEID